MLEARRQRAASTEEVCHGKLTFRCIPTALFALSPPIAVHATVLDGAAKKQTDTAATHAGMALCASELMMARAWRIKERLREVFAPCTDRATAEALRPRLIRWTRRRRPAPFRRLGATVKKHLAGILEHFRSRLNKGFAEAINGRVQAAKARAKSYGSDAHLITISYLVCAKLKHLSKNPWLHPAPPISAWESTTRIERAPRIPNRFRVTSCSAHTDEVDHQNHSTVISTPTS